jgi:ArsR family transcriptional regulator
MTMKKQISDYQRQAAILKAIAHPSRLLIIDLLREGPKCVNELTEAIGSDVSTVSRHLKTMKDTGLLTSTRDRSCIYYRLEATCIMDFIGCVDRVAVDRVRREMAELSGLKLLEKNE